ncbi:hypothetical protein [Bradyrhizobium sp. RDM4]|uniref:hypothetical protein n=1 Tax=Bradyrhizobium sp. RDM4 TaxID=3378765 RepID=UPI0038FC096F
MQKKYRNNGVAMVGIAAHEQASRADEARACLDACLTKSVRNLNYGIAFQFAGEINKLWMDPSSSVGIPTLLAVDSELVVDSDGRFAFTGPPTQLDNELPKVPKGSGAVCDESKALDAARINTVRCRKRKLSLKWLPPSWRAQVWQRSVPPALASAVTLMLSSSQGVLLKFLSPG